MKYTFSLFVIALLTLSVSASAQIFDINTVAGDGTQSFGGDGMAATNAHLSGPLAVGLDSLGNFYILDYFNLRIRKVNSGNVISTVAGNGLVGNTGDHGIATSAGMNPRGMAVDKLGNIYIADESYSVIRKVDHITNIITRYAGTTLFGYSGDGGPALSAELNSPHGMVIDAAGNLFIAEAGNHVIRKITAAGVISTVAGNDTVGYSGDFGPATSARLDSPYAVTVDRIGNLYISDHQNDVIRKVDTAGIITTYAGTYGVYGHTGDGGQASLATLNAPAGLTIDSVGNLYICDADNNVIRKVDATGKISTIAGTGAQGFGGDLSAAINSMLNNPYDVAVDKQGSLYIADANNQRVRKIYNSRLGVSTIVKSTIKVYPNPVAGEVTVSGLAKSDNVSVYDMAGRQVNSWIADGGTQSFKLSDLVAGTYMLQVSDNAGNKKLATKLVKE